MGVADSLIEYGTATGYKIGWREDFQEGKIRDIRKGFEIGYKKGLEIGYKKATEEIARAMWTTL